MVFLNNIFRFVVRLSKVLSRKGLYEFLEKEYSTIKANESVITIGAGGKVNQILQNYSKTIGFTFVSFDLDDKRNPDIIGDICFYDFKEMRFDVIVISEVLEHVPYPHLAMRNIHQTLNKEGRLILTVPFIFPIHDRPYDYYRYTRYGLEFLLKEFREVRINERNSWAECINMLAPRLIQENNKINCLIAPFFVCLAFFLFPFALLLGKIIQTDFMTTGYVVTAKK